MPRVALIFAVVFATYLWPLTNVVAPGQPVQPLHGPGGKDYVCQQVTKARFGEGTHEYWLYEPDRPHLSSAPLIVFFHGWSGTNPAIYGAWIEHLVRRGNVVVFPRYQANMRTPMSEFTASSIATIKEAIHRLQTEAGHVRPELNKFAIVGHSVGGLLTANVAALAKESALPKVRAMMSVEPAITWNPLRSLNVPLADLNNIPSDTLLLAVAGDNDPLANDRDARRIFYESTQVPTGNKNFVTLVSDSHGEPALDAGHHAPVGLNRDFDNGEMIRRARPGLESSATRSQMQNSTDESGSAQGSNKSIDLVAMSLNGTNGVDALDYYGLWKLFDGLTDAAFYGKNREYALGDTPQQRYMGVWSDGTAVKELVISIKP